MSRAGMRPGRRARLRWLVRGWLPDRNPLRRGSDRMEVVLLGVLLLLFLAVAPVAALRAGHWAATARQPAGGAGAQPHPVPAVLLQRAPVPPHSLFRGSTEPMVRARWAAPDGGARTGLVDAPAGTPAGHTVWIWTTASGRVVTAPPTVRDKAISETLAALFVVVAVGVVLATAGLAGHQLLDRRRLAAWDLGWSAIGPQWTGRR